MITITLDNGERVTGKVIYLTDLRVTLLLANGESLTVSQSSVKAYRHISAPLIISPSYTEAK